ncbi:MAG: ROK family protein, partial [Gammaproteobacteria bacterium]|nr:ROK family protein [Gammaproteobacteria bacterium]
MSPSAPVLGIDVGGSAVKAGRVDVAAGRLLGQLVSVPTPRPATPASLMPVLGQLVDQLPAGGSIGIAFPSVLKRGTAYTAANIDPSWIGVNAAAQATADFGRTVVFLNDADAAGLAEMRWGAGR